MSNLVKLTAEQAIVTLDQALVLVREAKTFREVRTLQDTIEETEVYLRTRRAATAMGDRLADLINKARDLRLEADIRQGELTSKLAPRDRAELLVEHKIPVAQARICEQAAKLPAKVRHAYVEIEKRRGGLAETSSLATLADLAPDKIKPVLQQLASRPKFQSVASAVRLASRPAAIPEWKPSPKTCQPPPLKTAIGQARLAKARIVKQLADRLVSSAERMAYVDSREVLSDFENLKAELAAALKLC